MSLRSIRTLAALVWLLPAAAHARNPPIAVDPKEGVWIGGGEVFLQQTVDRWSVFPAPGTVNKLAVDGLTLWIATDDGVLRFDSGSRRATRMTMDDGLPSQSVAAVAFDDQFVWFATNKGLVRYRKLDRALRVYTDQEGLPHRAVNDALTVGRQVWFATRAGLAYYDPTVDGLRGFTKADGLAGDDFFELFQLGDDVWVRTDVGLSRVRPKSRVITNFAFKNIGGEQLRTFVLDGDSVWIGTENGLINFASSSDAFTPFPQQAALESRSIVGVEIFTDYIFIATDKEVVQYNKLNRSIRRFTEADGLARHAGATGTVVASGLFTVMFPDGAEVLDIQRDLWTSKTKQATEESDKAAGFRLFGRLNAEEPLDLNIPGSLKKKLTQDRFATALGGFGFGYRFDGNRTLDVSSTLDYGQLEMKGIRDLQYKAEYLGNTQDVVREVRIEDKLKYRTLEEGLERPILLQGAHARVASKGEEPAVSAQVDGGQRRGATQRDFLPGPRKEIYPLSKRYILPGSERVWVDGELLTNGTDYTVIYPAGQLAFLDPERVDDLSIIEVEYEYDLMAKKGLGVLSLLDLLPADKEVGDWSRTGDARLISEESGLFAQIDGAAPKYIDRGWTRSVYAEYRQGSRTIQVALHDMGTEANATSIYTLDLPGAREAVDGTANLVIDVGLATSFAAKAHSQTYYIELSIDEKSDQAKQSLKLFASQILNRGSNSGANVADDPKEWLAAVRVAAAPFHGTELGARVVELQGTGLKKEDKPLRRLTTGVVDARYEREVGEGGRFTGYAELAGTRDRVENKNGWAGMGMLRLSHPSLEGTLTARHESDNYEPIGSDATLFGRLRDDVRLSVTGYPTRWLPATAFYMRETSRTDDGGTGTVQQALARVQLNKDGLPSLSLQGGHTLLESPESSTSRVKAVGQADYDLAQGPLGFLGFKRFSLRGLYGVSQATTSESGYFSHGDRVQLARLEAKIAPTNTEQAYALFRSRVVQREASQGGPFNLSLAHWELNSGARSMIVPGLIPQVNYTVLYDDDRTGADPLRASKGSLSGSLGVYPGQWIGLLAPVVIEPRYSLAHDAQAQSDLRTQLNRAHRIDNRAVWTGTRLELEFYQLWEVDDAGEDQHPTVRKLELRNRVLFRPLFNSPITLRLSYIGQATLNDLQLAPNAPMWGRQATWEGVIEWLMRWNKKLTTKLRADYSWGRVRDLVFVDTSTNAASIQDSLQQRITGGVELRIFPFEQTSRLFLLQRNQVYELFGQGTGSTDAWGFETTLGAIWTLGANLYLDGAVDYHRQFCLEQTCTPVNMLTPRVLLTFNL